MQTRQRVLSLLIAFWSFCLTAFAQGNLVTGTVVDSNGEGVIGASVVLKSDKTQGTTTDIDGNFSLRLPSREATLVISYVGMRSQEVKATAGKKLNVSLEEDSEILEDVIVVGYGQQKKASVVGAITQTTGKTLERAAGISDVASALTGNLPGVITSAAGGIPGEDEPTIVIRGSSSWNASAPLVLVDGIERPLSSVDMGSVESISVLKDASATAVYGVKGANGVILVTTKRGQEGRPQINVSANAIMKMPSKLPGKYDSYDALMFRNIAAEHELAASQGTSWSDMHTQDFINNYRNQTTLEQRERYANVDWQDELFKEFCMSYNAAINVSGGTKFVRYYAAIDYVNEGDLFREFDSGRGYKAGYGYNRINVRSNLDFQLSKTTVFKVGMSGGYGVSEQPYERALYADAGDAWQVSRAWEGAYSTPPDAFLPKYSDGSWGYYAPDSQLGNSARTNAVGGTNSKTRTNIYTDFTLEQDLAFITKGLSFRGIVSWDNRFVESSRGINDQYKGDPQLKWIDPETGVASEKSPYDPANHYDYAPGIKWTLNSGSVQNWQTTRNFYYQTQLNWARKFGKHDITAMGLFSRTENATGSSYPHYREDWAFRTTYNYADRYNVEYNGAYNGSEKFSSKNRFAFFNSGAIGWTISNEPWMKPLREYSVAGMNLIDMLKFRASYGEIGDDSVAGSYLYMSEWGTGNGVNMDNTDGSWSPYGIYREASVGNEDVHWEVVRKFNFGIDYSFLSGMLAGSFDIFQDKRTDILIGGADRSVPNYFGQKAPTANLGKVTTKGWELELRVNKQFGKHRVWGNFNMTHAANKIDVRDDAPFLAAYRKQAGYAIGQARGYINDKGFINNQDQLFGTPAHDNNDSQRLVGDYSIVDFNGDGKVDSNDYVPFGYSGTPENTYNATVGYDWKGFSCFVQFYGVTNVTRQVDLKSFSSRFNCVYDQGSWWSQSGAGADVVTPRINTMSGDAYYYGTQMFYDGSYVRLKNIEFAYTWTNKSWIKKMGLSNLKLFVSGNNLWMYTNMPDDREANNAFYGSIGAYPTVKRFNLGLKFTL